MTSLEAIDEVLLSTSCTIDLICAELAKMFGVRSTEVGILRLEGELLTFLYPAELQAVGCIPISGTGVAARTAATKKAELYNNFATIPHRTVFELVKLKDPEIKEDEHPRIQKLMSAPVLGEENVVLGVVQVSRKGVNPGAAGPDFTGEELQYLERVARRVATLRPEILLTVPKKPRWKLELQNEQKKKAKAKAAGRS
jgi:GAF domain-containing protein